MQQITRAGFRQAAAIFTAVVMSSAAAAAEPTIFDRLQGEWTAQGSAFGGDVVASMTWSPVLDGKFHRIEYRMEITRDGAVQVFEGTGHYRAPSGAETRGYWADTNADLHPIAAKVDADAIVTHWGVAGEKQGRTEYRLTADGAVSVTDWILTGEGWRQFNQATFTRAGN